MDPTGRLHEIRRYERCYRSSEALEIKLAIKEDNLRCLLENIKDILQRFEQGPLVLSIPDLTQIFKNGSGVADYKRIAGYFQRDVFLAVKNLIANVLETLTRMNGIHKQILDGFPDPLSLYEPSRTSLYGVRVYADRAADFIRLCERNMLSEAGEFRSQISQLKSAAPLRSMTRFQYCRNSIAIWLKKIALRNRNMSKAKHAMQEYQQRLFNDTVDDVMAAIATLEREANQIVSRSQ